MTLEELKQTIDTYLGLTSQVEPKYEDSVRLVYFSPTGIRLFDVSISVYDEADGWEFAGNSSALPESWKALCWIHKQEAKAADDTA